MADSLHLVVSLAMFVLSVHFVPVGPRECRVTVWAINLFFEVNALRVPRQISLASKRACTLVTGGSWQLPGLIIEAIVMEHFGRTMLCQKVFLKDVHIEEHGATPYAPNSIVLNTTVPVFSLFSPFLSN